MIIAHARDMADLQGWEPYNGRLTLPDEGPVFLCCMDEEFTFSYQGANLTHPAGDFMALVGSLESGFFAWPVSAEQLETDDGRMVAAQRIAAREGA